MAMKEQQRSIYRTAKGKEIDLGRLINQNELTIAVGNMKVNARGDKLGPTGEILQKREDIPKQPQNVPSIINSPVTQVKTHKDISNHDPEGKE